MSWEGLKPWWGAQFLQPLPGVIYILWFPHMSTLVGNYLHTHTRISSISLHNIISHRVMLPQILNIPESSWHILTPFRTFLSGQAAFLPRPWMLRMGVRQQKVYGSQAGLDCRMILDDLGCFDSTVVSCVLHHIALYCILLLLVWHIFSKYTQSLHDFACLCMYLHFLAVIWLLWR